jgi:hypothetical protein
MDKLLIEQVPDAASISPTPQNNAAPTNRPKSYYFR